MTAPVQTKRRRAQSPGVLGWAAVAVVVGVADGYALLRKDETMSDVFADHTGWGVFFAAGIIAHLMTHRRLPTVR